MSHKPCACKPTDLVFHVPVSIPSPRTKSMNSRIFILQDQTGPFVSICYMFDPSFSHNLVLKKCPASCAFRPPFPLPCGIFCAFQIWEGTSKILMHPIKHGQSLQSVFHIVFIIYAVTLLQFINIDTDFGEVGNDLVASLMWYSTFAYFWVLGNQASSSAGHSSIYYILD